MNSWHRDRPAPCDLGKKGKGDPSIGHAKTLSKDLEVSNIAATAGGILKETPYVRNITQARQYAEVPGASPVAGDRVQQAATRFHLEKHHTSPHMLDTWSEKHLSDRDDNAPAN